MASLLDSKSVPPIKLILMSVSGGGKTSSIVPLAIPEIVPGWPGRKLFVLNFDGRGKFQELAKAQLDARLAARKDVTKISQSQYDAAIANIQFEDCIDPAKIRRDAKGELKAEKLMADAWGQAKKAMDKWYPQLDSNAIVVVDSFTHLAKAIASYTMGMANRLNVRPEFYVDYAPAQAEIGNALNVFSALDCSLIVTAHQDTLEVKKMSETPEKDPVTGEMKFVDQIVDTLMLPQSFGRAGRVDIPTTMNHLLYLTTNKNHIREIRLEPGRGIVPKTPFFALAQSSYGLDRGLVQYFMLGATK